MGVSSFYHVGSRNRTNVIMFGSKHPYLLSYLVGPILLLETGSFAGLGVASMVRLASHQGPVISSSLISSRFTNVQHHTCLIFSFSFWFGVGCLFVCYLLLFLVGWFGLV